MEVQLLRCWQPACPHTYYTFTELSNHHLDAHEIPLLVRPVAPWQPQARRTRWAPMLRGANAIAVVATNGATPPREETL